MRASSLVPTGSRLPPQRRLYLFCIQPELLQRLTMAAKTSASRALQVSRHRPFNPSRPIKAEEHIEPAHLPPPIAVHRFEIGRHLRHLRVPLTHVARDAIAADSLAQPFGAHPARIERFGLKLHLVPHQ